MSQSYADQCPLCKAWHGTDSFAVSDKLNAALVEIDRLREENAELKRWDALREAMVAPYLLGVAASSMIYVAVADLIPGLHKRPELSATLEQVLLIGLGIAAITVIGHFGHPS